MKIFHGSHIYTIFYFSNIEKYLHNHKVLVKKISTMRMLKFFHCVVHLNKKNGFIIVLFEY